MQARKLQLAVLHCFSSSCGAASLRAAVIATATVYVETETSCHLPSSDGEDATARAHRLFAGKSYTPRPSHPVPGRRAGVGLYGASSFHFRWQLLT